ncbi:MAG: hypothetical protein LBR70_07320 [Lactobacillaceae bacterium]|jgi:hypothetical protein|nr:hypothetical protein [Lactobacillaceae bacterium]
MRKISITVLILSLFVSVSASAQTGEGVTSFQQDRDSWRRQTAKGPEILGTIYDSMGNIAMKNITDSEQIYCYVVDAAAPDYEGYAIDGMAVKSFCGVFDQELKSIFVGSILGNEEAVSTKIEQCAIRPKLMFRFIRGVDYTDVLLSSPCYSFTIFYGGKLKTYNFSNGSGVIDELVSIFAAEDVAVPFVSPALLDQMVPVGVAETDDQKNKVKQSSSSSATGPIRNWESEVKEAPAPKTGGWNNLNL